MASTLGVPLLDLGPGAAYGINNSGQVTGVFTPVGSLDSHAFIYSGGVMTDLGTVGSDSRGLAINSSGQVVGWDLSTGAQHAFLYAGSGMTDLNGLMPGGADSSTANAINDSGTVAGSFVSSVDGLTHAFVYANGVVVDLGPGELTGINTTGNVVGNLDPGAFRSFSGNGYAFRFPLPDLGGGCTVAAAMNDFGQVVGQSWDSTDPNTGACTGMHAFFFDEGNFPNQMIDIGTLFGLDTFATALNFNGDIAGYSNTGNLFDSSHAFFYNGVTGSMMDINPYGWTNTQAFAINDSLYMAGTGINPSGSSDILVWTPEPGSFVLVGGCLLGILLRLRRKSPRPATP